MTLKEKLDLFKLNKAQYKAGPKPGFTQVEAANYLSIEGRGEPGGEQFQDKTAGLYAMAYTIKMTRKAQGLQDYVICKLEGLWTHDEDPMGFADRPKAEWRWNLIIRTPDFVTRQELTQAADVLISKGKTASVKEVELVSLAEGKCVQMLHIGPYDQEGETVEAMASFARDNGFCMAPRHHEIYLSDPRRVEPDKLKTILRYPVVPEASA